MYRIGQDMTHRPGEVKQERTGLRTAEVGFACRSAQEERSVAIRMC